MKFETLFILVFSLISLSSNCQEIDSLSQWQKSNPNIVFISNEKFNQLTSFEKKLLGSNYVVFDNQITTKYIQYNSKSGLKSNSLGVPFSYDDPNAQIIKNWLGLNKHVKLMRVNSEYQAQNSLESTNVLFYYGEFLTLQDIESYEN